MSAPASWDEAVRMLGEWRAHDWIRPLDVAFARFVGTLAADARAVPGGRPAPAADATVALLAAMLSHLEGRGHTCLALAELAARPAELLNWPADAMAAWMLASQGPSPTLLADWLDALRDSPVVDATASHGGHQPIVLHGDRLYLRRHWRQERAVASQVAARVARPLAVDEAAAARILVDLFGDPAVPKADAADAADADEPDWQRLACAIALRASLSIITGGPGTGKTYTVARLLTLLLKLAPADQPPRITLAAPTGKAAARLRQSIEQALGSDLAVHIGKARTLHALLGVQPGTRRFRHDAANPLDVDVLIVDEASMVHLEMMAALLDALPSGARLVLLGDKDQLASVEAGAVLGDLCRQADEGGYDAETAAYLERLTGQRLPPALTQGHKRTQPPTRKQASAAAQGDLFDAVPLEMPAEGPALLPVAGAPVAATALARQTVMLRKSHRFGGAIGQLALAVNAGDALRALRVLSASPEAGAGERAEVSCRTPAEPADVVRLSVPAESFGGYRDYLNLLARRPRDDDMPTLEAWVREMLDAFDRFRVLCAVREGPWGVSGLNQAIEAALLRQGLLRKGGDWYEGRPVMVMRNDPALGVYNGDVGLVLRWPAGAPGRPPVLRVFFKDGDDAPPRSVPAGRLSEVETAFAMTVHKSQGSEFGHAVLALSEDVRGTITRELVYTGITRARQAFSLVAARADIFTAAIGRRTRRHSGLADALVELSSEP